MAHPDRLRLSRDDRDRGSEPPELARRYAEAERRLEPQRARSIARGPIGLIGVLAVLSLAVGIVAAIDLNRLQTPRGTALAWTGSAVFGDCTAYERLSVPELDGDWCLELRAATEAAREQSVLVAIDVLAIRVRGPEAVVDVRVRQPVDGEVVESLVELPLRRRDDGWVVLRTPEVCEAVFCPLTR